VYRTLDQSAATQLELDVDVFLDFLSELEAAGHEGEITGDVYMYLLDEYQAGKARGANVISPRRYFNSVPPIFPFIFQVDRVSCRLSLRAR